MSESRTENATGVFVLGMHRSGTSAITRVINVLGFEVGDNLMPSKPDNSKGFWEDWDVVHLNEQILRSGGESWDSPSLFDTKDLSSDRHERYIQLASELLQRKFNNIPRFVIKDPRISLLMPIWVEACERLQINLSYVLCLRHPASVASSLASRNAMALDQALLLWLNHLYSILRDCPAPLLVVGYENLLSDTRNELRRVAEFLDVSNLSVVTDIEDKILDKTLDHFPVERLANCGWLALVDEVYHALCQHQEGPPISSEQQTELLASFALDDLLLTELNRSALTAKREQVQKQKVDAVIEENHSLITSLERIRSRLPYLEADGVKAAAELSELKSQLVAVKADRDNVDSDRTRIDIERIKLLDINRLVVEDKQRLEQEFGALKQELGASKQEFGALKQELDVLQQELARLSSVEEEKDEFRAQYTLLQSDYESKIDELNEKAAELLNIQDLSNDATAQLNDAKDELDDTRDRLNGATTEIVNLRNSYERISN